MQLLTFIYMVIYKYISLSGHQTYDQSSGQEYQNGNGDSWI